MAKMKFTGQATNNDGSKEGDETSTARDSVDGQEEDTGINDGFSIFKCPKCGHEEKTDGTQDGIETAQDRVDEDEEAPVKRAKKKVAAKLAAMGKRDGRKYE